jgi:hypothetical protein
MLKHIPFRNTICSEFSSLLCSFCHGVQGLQHSEVFKASKILCYYPTLDWPLCTLNTTILASHQHLGTISAMKIPLKVFSAGPSSYRPKRVHSSGIFK